MGVIEEVTEDATPSRGSLHSYGGSPVPDLRQSSRLSGDAGGVEVLARLSGNL
jgi:hypothetical protein